MTEQLKMIGERIRDLREVLGLTQKEVAKSSQISLGEYISYEEGKSDFSYSNLHNISKTLGVNVSHLLSGESPKLSNFIVTRAGKGVVMDTDSDYDYRHLALNFQNKLIEPLFVTINPEKQGARAALHSHKGQEFDYVLSGTLKFVIDDIEVILNPGDSLLFNSMQAHAMYALNDKPTTFLAVVTE